MLHLKLFNYAEILTCMVSIYYAKRLFRTPFWVLTPYMIMIVVVELSGKYFAERKKYVDNVHIFNISTVVEFVVFFYLLHQNIKSTLFKKVILWTTPVYLLLTAYNEIFIQGFNNLHTYTLVLGSVILIIFIFFYFYEAFSTTEPIVLTREPMFWIAIGLFLFYLGDLTYNLIHPYLVSRHMQKEGMKLIRLINNNLIIFEYICFSIAMIICGNRNNLSTSRY